ncbi:hypothetical protein [Streptomyces sp. NPDC059009]|uniref:hypothetical protein n=1 Tax=Streptomyces sp. NPDC059009 TaxID=3346694 RepID=UPI0036BA1F07
MKKVGHAYHKGVGPKVGMQTQRYKDKLKYAKKLSTSRSTSWTFGGSASVSWGIGKIEAKTDYNVTKKTTTGYTVTATLTIPKKSYGAIQPKARYQKFSIKRYISDEACHTRVLKNYGTMGAIVDPVDFRTCVSRRHCSP